MDLLGMEMAARRRQMQLTVLHRRGGEWHNVEVSRLVNGLRTELSQHPKFPEYLVLFGHYTKEETLKAIGGGIAYTAKQVTGLHSPDLPFVPSMP